MVTASDSSEDNVRHPGATSAHEEQLTAAHEKVRNLRLALESSRVIGTAIGILMERHKVSSAEAMARLAAASQSSHRKLHAIAADLVYTGELSIPTEQEDVPTPAPGRNNP